MRNRIGLTVLTVLLAAAPGWGTPLHPDVRKLQKQQQGKNYPAARAGWDGPEVKSRAQQPPNTTMEMFGPAAVARAVRASLVSAALPDWRVIGCVLLVILLLRRMHRRKKLASSGEVDRKALIQPTEEAELSRAA